MDYKEFLHLDWKNRSHLAKTDEHCAVYVAEHKGHTFSCCFHTPTEEYKKEHPHAKSYEHYMIDGKVYKSRRVLIEALEKLD